MDAKIHFVSSTRIHEIMGAVDNSIDIFKASSERLLEELGANPNSHDEKLAFARKIDASYRDAATSALRLSKDLGYSDFERDVFNWVIQFQTPIAELKDWSSRFSAIKANIDKFSNLAPLKMSWLDFQSNR